MSMEGAPLTKRQRQVIATLFKRRGLLLLETDRRAPKRDLPRGYRLYTVPNAQQDPVDGPPKRVLESVIAGIERWLGDFPEGVAFECVRTVECGCGEARRWYRLSPRGRGRAEVALLEGGRTDW